MERITDTRYQWTYLISTDTLSNCILMQRVTSTVVLESRACSLNDDNELALSMSNVY